MYIDLIVRRKQTTSNGQENKKRNGLIQKIKQERKKKIKLRNNRMLEALLNFDDYTPDTIKKILIGQIYKVVEVDHTNYPEVIV